MIGSNEEYNWILGIVRDWKGFHFDITDLKRLAGLKNPAIELSLGLATDGVQGQSIGVDWDAEFSRDNFQSHGMVRMFVGD